MTTINQLMEQAGEYLQHTHDHKAAVKEFYFNEAAEIVAPVYETGLALPPMTLTDTAYDQAITKLGPVVYGKGNTRLDGNIAAMKRYLMAVPPDLRAVALNRHIEDGNGGDWLVRGYDDKCRAVLSGDFMAVNHFEALGILNTVIAENPVGRELRFARPHLDPDDMNLKVMWRDVDKGGSQGGYGVGTYYGNGEVGNRKWRVAPCIQRNSCENSIVWLRDSALAFVHMGNMATKAKLVQAKLVETFGLAASVLDKLVASDSIKVPDIESVLKGLAVKYGWDEDTRTAVAVGTEGHETLWGVVEGVAAAAKRFEGNTQTDMEVTAGNILADYIPLFAEARKLAEVRVR